MCKDFNANKREKNHFPGSGRRGGKGRAFPQFTENGVKILIRRVGKNSRGEKGGTDR